MGRKDPFENGEYYHVFNRGVDKRLVFKDVHDYRRFMFMVEQCNTCSAVNNLKRTLSRSDQGTTKKKRTEYFPLVRMHAHCLMPNHYHLILEQVSDGGISKFLQKVMTGYTHYFNLRHDRSGVLFQGRTKSKLITGDDYLRWLREYIAMNPLDLCESGWKENGIKNMKRSLEFLKAYPWRSKFDYADFKKHVKEYGRTSLRHDVLC